jgi:hypothetical protein
MRSMPSVFRILLLRFCGPRIQSYVVFSCSRDGVLSRWTIPLSGFRGDPSHTVKVRNVGRSEAEDMSDQQEDDPMMVDEDVRGRIKPNGRPSATLRCCQTSHEFRKFSL